MRIPPTLFAALLLAAGPTLGQSTDPIQPSDAVHYTYSALFGTGVYRLDDRTVTVLRAPLSYRVRDAEPGKPGIQLKLPVTLGVHRLDVDDILGILDDDPATATVLPGIQLDFPVGDRWRLSTAAYYGAGYEFDSSVWSQVFGGTASANYSFPHRDLSYELGSDLTIAGHKTGSDSSKTMTRLGVGMSVKIPTRWSWRETPLFVNPQLIAYHYFGEAEFTTLELDQPLIDLDTEFKFGLAVGTERPIRILGFRFDRIGLSYRYSRSGLTGVGIVAGFPF